LELGQDWCYVRPEHIFPELFDEDADLTELRYVSEEQQADAVLYNVNWSAENLND
jgi:hypothetical protein